MLHSPILAPPFQVADAHWQIGSEFNDKTTKGTKSAIPDEAIFQKSLATLPCVTFQAGETVIAEGSRTGRLLILGKGTVSIIKKDTEIAMVAEPGAVFGELSILLDQPHTAEVRAVETSLFHVADAASFLAQHPVAVLYVATVLARRLDGANRTLIQLKSQLHAGEPDSLIAKTVSKMERLLVDGGCNLVYAGYPSEWASVHIAAVHESAFGTKRTSRAGVPMSAFGGKADMMRMCPDVRL
jgi:CRP-like cAMP-binding protein